jgi:hypothetical protein
LHVHLAGFFLNPMTNDRRSPHAAHPAHPAPEPELYPRELPPGPPSVTRRRRARTWFWPGFVLGFVLLSLVSCGSLALATGVSRLRLADLQAGQPAWTPPAVTATPVVTPLPAAEIPLEQGGGAFQPNERLANITNSLVNLRATPGYLSKPGGDVIGQVPAGGQVEILGGRALADGLTWWRVRYLAPDGGVIDGWIAEATASGVQILGR